MRVKEPLKVGRGMPHLYLLDGVVDFYTFKTVATFRRVHLVDLFFAIIKAGVLLPAHHSGGPDFDAYAEDIIPDPFYMYDALPIEDNDV